MSIKERKEREREERRELVLNVANEIIKEEGIDNLSIRKIANRIEYSPAIIYHYFRDKDEIINHLMRKGYQKIISVLSSVQASENEPEQRLKEVARKYIDMALQMPDEYKSIMLNTSPGILEHTTVLFQGAASKRQAVGILYQNLRDIYLNQGIDDSLIELSAQVIWTAAFGLIIRLIIEKDISEEQRKKLIEHHIKIIIDGAVLGKSLNNC